ncbi:MAG: hypothetical protein JO281_01945 [Pseudonocardiales bacterium]|nr:hypothetical protein [Pseudonocardiales bacterium]
MIRFVGVSAIEWAGWVELERAVRALSVVVPHVLGQDSAQVPFTEDQHPVGHEDWVREFWTFLGGQEWMLG